MCAWCFSRRGNVRCRRSSTDQPVSRICSRSGPCEHETMHAMPCCLPPCCPTVPHLSVCLSLPLTARRPCLLRAEAMNLALRSCCRSSALLSSAPAASAGTISLPPHHLGGGNCLPVTPIYLPPLARDERSESFVAVICCFLVRFGRCCASSIDGRASRSRSFLRTLTIPLSSPSSMLEESSVATTCRWLVVTSESRLAGARSIGNSVPPRGRRSSSFARFSLLDRPQCDDPPRCLTATVASRESLQSQSLDSALIAGQRRRCSPADPLPFLRCLAPIPKRHPTALTESGCHPFDSLIPPIAQFFFC